MTWSIKEMAVEVINLIKDGSCINLGIGLPTILAEYISPSKNIVIHSENGVLGVNGSARTFGPPRCAFCFNAACEL